MKDCGLYLKSRWDKWIDCEPCSVYQRSTYPLGQTSSPGGEGGRDTLFHFRAKTKLLRARGGTSIDHCYFSFFVILRTTKRDWLPSLTVEDLPSSRFIRFSEFWRIFRRRASLLASWSAILTPYFLLALLSYQHKCMQPYFSSLCEFTSFPDR